MESARSALALCMHACASLASGDDLTRRHLYAISIEPSSFAFPFEFVSSSFPHFVERRRAFEKKSEFAMNPISVFAQDVT